MLLYIHIPFCDSKCHYCAFNSTTSLHHLKEKYVESLCKQLHFELKNLSYDILETVFIGGGTPSTLDLKDYKKIFNILTPYLTNTKEITIEANPNSATYTWLEDMYSLGINRISFGVQSFNDEKLDFLGRNHNSKMAISAIQNASKVGFKNINCDIIYDTKLDTKQLLDDDFAIIKTLPCNHISAYSLTLEEGTKFFNKSNVRIEDIDMANYIFDRLKDMGFYQYEISNFATANEAKSKHNLGYWKYEEYLGIGAGAVGCIGGKRLYTYKDINMYISNPTIYNDIEELSNEDIKVEKLLLGFRSEVGVSKSMLSDKELLKANNLEKSDKIISKDDNRFYSTDFMLADELALYIL